MTKEILEITGDLKKQYCKNEILAELFSYLLMKRFDEKINFNYAYSNVWSSKIIETFDIKEFERYIREITIYLDQFSDQEDDIDDNDYKLKLNYINHK